MDDEIMVTVIATDFGDNDATKTDTNEPAAKKTETEDSAVELTSKNFKPVGQASGFQGSSYRTPVQTSTADSYSSFSSDKTDTDEVPIDIPGFLQRKKRK